jgi:hypothetical protein
MNPAIVSAVSALVGAGIGGLSTLLGSWIVQRTQIKAEWSAREYHSRQTIFRDFIQTASRCYADALQHNEIDIAEMVDLHAHIERVRIHSSPELIASAIVIRQTIIEAYLDTNRSEAELRALLVKGSIDLLGTFAELCRQELEGLHQQRF